jgi:hypothetical protein
VSRRGELHTGIWWGDLRKGDHLEDPGVEEDNIKMDLQEVGWWAWTGLIWLRIGTGNEPSGSIKCEEFLD